MIEADKGSEAIEIKAQEFFFGFFIVSSKSLRE